MTTSSFTFRLICPRIVNISYLWAHDRWRHIRPRGQAGCLASLVELLLFLWNKTRSCVLTLQSRSRFPARHCCPVQPLIPAAGIPANLGRRQSRDLSQAAWDIPLPPYSNHPILSVTNTFQKQALAGVQNMDCPKNKPNSTLQSCSQHLLANELKNPGQVLPFV